MGLPCASNSFDRRLPCCSSTGFLQFMNRLSAFHVNCPHQPYFYVKNPVMPFLQSFSIQANKQHPFPFNIPAVQYAGNVALDKRVTIFVGDNGSGKSTLLKSLAFQLNLPLIGGFIKEHEGFDAAKALQPYLHLEWNR